MVLPFYKNGSLSDFLLDSNATISVPGLTQIVSKVLEFYYSSHLSFPINRLLDLGVGWRIFIHEILPLCTGIFIQ